MALGSRTVSNLLQETKNVLVIACHTLISKTLTSPLGSLQAEEAEARYRMVQVTHHWISQQSGIQKYSYLGEKGGKKSL